MNTMIECMRQRERVDRGVVGGGRVNDRDTVLSLHRLRQLQQEHFNRILGGNVLTRQSTSASALEDGATGYGPNSVVYGVPSYPAVGRVIGFYNQNTMVFELDDMYTRASPSEIHQLIMSGGAADAEAENFVAVGVPLTYSASAATGAGADAADSTAPSELQQESAPVDRGVSYPRAESGDGARIPTGTGAGGSDASDAV